MFALKAIPRPPAWAVLTLALAASLGLNLWQAKDRWIKDATAPLQAKIDGLTATAGAEDKISQLRGEHDRELAQAREDAAANTGKRQVVYRDRIREVPVPFCPPGQDRVDAWNAAGQEATK